MPTAPIPEVDIKTTEVEDGIITTMTPVQAFKKRIFWPISLTIICLIALAGYSGWLATEYYAKLQLAEQHHSTLEVKYNALLAEDRDFAKLEQENEVLHQRLEAIRTDAVQDLSAYIQARYSKVPQELAVLIANKTYDICLEQEADFSTIVGIMEVESAFNPMAISRVNARGLMQILPKVWMEPLDVKNASDFHDIVLNIKSGVHVYLTYLAEEKGNISRALNRYNGSDPAKGKYAAQVYEKVGRFITFRNNTFEGVTDHEEPEEEKITEG